LESYKLLGFEISIDSTMLLSCCLRVLFKMLIVFVVTRSFDETVDLLPMFQEDDALELADFGIKSSPNLIMDSMIDSDMVDISAARIVEIRSRFSPTQFSVDEMMSTSRDSLPNIEELVSYPLVQGSSKLFWLATPKLVRNISRPS
jgi:hypothetical protein